MEHMIKFKPESFDKISCAEMGCKYSKLCTLAKYQSSMFCIIKIDVITIVITNKINAKQGV